MTLECTTVRAAHRALHGQWHAIFQTGCLDYCREDAPASIDSVEDAKQWAVNLFATMAGDAARREVDSYRLERW
jgi:hypothetical protein